MLGIKYKCNYASVFAQGQGSPIGEFSLQGENIQQVWEKYNNCFAICKKEWSRRRGSVLKVKAFFKEFLLLYVICYMRKMHIRSRRSHILNRKRDAICFCSYES